MKCRACNKILEDYELSNHPHVPDMTEDLCITCKQSAYESLLEQQEDELQVLIDDLQDIVDSST